ncbi:hypothetical protein QTP88_017112 [Uroleucon formosanum]
MIRRKPRLMRTLITGSLSGSQLLFVCIVIVDFLLGTVGTLFFERLQQTCHKRRSEEIGKRYPSICVLRHWCFRPLFEKVKPFNRVLVDRLAAIGIITSTATTAILYKHEIIYICMYIQCITINRYQPVTTVTGITTTMMMFSSANHAFHWEEGRMFINMMTTNYIVSLLAEIKRRLTFDGFGNRRIAAAGRRHGIIYYAHHHCVEGIPVPPVPLKLAADARAVSYNRSSPLDEDGRKTTGHGCVIIKLPLENVFRIPTSLAFCTLKTGNDSSINLFDVRFVDRNANRDSHIPAVDVCAALPRFIFDTNPKKANFIHNPITV